MKASILVIEDDPTLNLLLVKELRKAGYEIESASSWREARQRLDSFAPNLVLLDVNLPDASGFEPLAEIAATRPVVMLTAYGSVNQAVQAMRLGAADYLVKPVNLDELELVIQAALERSHASTQKALRQTPAPADAGQDMGMIGISPAMRLLRKTIAEVGASEVSVLIQGESGSGKELVAQALHAASARQGEGFVPVDCCTLQETLFESELFGHEKGAFTGADRRKPGLIEAASGGTLFLDEIGEAGPAIQAKLLRVLETGRFRRVGATSDLRANARIVAATNRRLIERARDGHFREDLYYRLATFIIDVPPLRARVEDIAPLAQHFIARRRQASGQTPAELTPDALLRLQTYAWPGNVRELRNVIERALIVAGNAPRIEAWHLGTLDALDSSATPATGAAAGSSASVLRIGDAAGGDAPVIVLRGQPTLESIEREYLASLLERHNGNRRKVAEALGVSERTAYRMLERHGYK